MPNNYRPSPRNHRLLKVTFPKNFKGPPDITRLARLEAWRRVYLGVGRNGPARSLPWVEIKRRQALEEAARK